MPTINGKVCVVNGVPVDKVFSNGKQVYGRNYFSVSGFATNKYTGPYAVDYYDIQLLPETKYTISTTHIRDDGVYDVFVGNKGFTADSGVNGLGATKPRTVTTDSTGILTVGARNYSLADSKDKIKVELGTVATPWSPAPEDVLENYIAAPKNLTATVIDLSTEKLDWE